jgi:hypothetical protein
MLNVFHRDGETILHFWAPNSSMHPSIPGKNPATSAPSSRCGTCSISPARAAQPIGTSSSATDHPGGGKDTDHPCIRRSGPLPEATPTPAQARSSSTASTSQTRGNTRTIERRPGQRPAGCEPAFPAAIAPSPVTLPPAPSSCGWGWPEGPVPGRFEVPIQQRRETAVSPAAQAGTVPASSERPTAPPRAARNAIRLEPPRRLSTRHHSLGHMRRCSRSRDAAPGCLMRWPATRRRLAS